MPSVWLKVMPLCIASTRRFRYILGTLVSDVPSETILQKLRNISHAR